MCRLFAIGRKSASAPTHRQLLKIEKTIYNFFQLFRGCPMKLLLAIISLTFVASTAFAIDFRWTSGFGQGTLEANIGNGNDSRINIFCPEWQTDTTPGMFIHVKRINPQRDELVTVQIIVDGKNHPFYLKEIEFKALTRTDKWEFRELVRALASSKQKSFVVEFPKYNTSETFSLLDAQKTLGLGKHSMMKGCDNGD
jgi:hypothetical protein